MASFEASMASFEASMASFEARIGWKRPRKKENKYCRSVSFLPYA